MDFVKTRPNCHPTNQNPLAPMDTVLNLRNHVLGWRLFQFLKRDGRHHQILYLLLFMGYGLTFLRWDTEAWKYGLTVATCLAVQAGFVALTGGKWSSLKSAFISSLSLCLMLKFNAWTTILVAAGLTIASKFAIRVRGKHVFNPTNFGIIACILLTGDAWISPGQWGSQALLMLFFGVTGFFVLFKVGRIDTGLTFLATFAVLTFIRSYFYLGWPIDHFWHTLSSGTLLLFAFFMITDPVSTPSHPRARIVWAMLVGGLAFGLTGWFYVHSAPIWALFFMAPITPLFDKLFAHQKFSWT